jgi:hypothetical protein
MNQLRDVFLFLGLGTLPVYIFPSGLPQPAHLFLCAFFLCSLSDGKITLRREDWFLGALFLFSFTRESIAVIGGAKNSSIIYPFFTLFNLSVLVFLRNYFQQTLPHQRQYYIRGICVAGLIAVFSILSSGYALFGNAALNRATGTFNNPNQMAYFAVCLGALALTLYLARLVNIHLAILLLAAGLLLVLAALSKAGLIGFMLVLFIFSISIARRSHWGVCLIVFITIPALATYILASGYFDQSYALQRLYGIGSDGDDTLYQRGYLMFRHFNTPFEIISGLGGDKVQSILSHEVHSTLFYNLVNYGFMGFLLYVGFLIIWAKQILKSFGAIAMIGITGAPMLYGLAHNGTRFTVFYILIASGLSLAREAALYKTNKPN